MAKSTGRRIIIDDPSDNVAIRVSDVSKSFRLPHNRQNSIKGSLVNLIGGGDRSYETQEVLKDISFEIKKGEFFGIVGRNGSGKSTLLKMLAGIYKPTAGEITVNGSLTPFIELGVGFNPELTGRENVYMNGALLGFNDREVDAMYDDIVEFAELERFMDQKLKNYSSGMQVRLAFSIAIRAKSDILLIDEVLAVGDAAFQQKCFKYFDLLKKEKRTIVLVTHDMGAVRQFCTRAMLIHDGSVVHIGPTDTAALKYEKLNYDNNSPKKPGDTAQAEQIEVVTLDANGKETDSFEYNEPIRIHVDWSAIEAAVSMIGIVLFKGNEVIFATNTAKQKIDVSKQKKIDLVYTKPDFGNGRYRFNVVAFGSSRRDILYTKITDAIIIYNQPTLGKNNEEWDGMLYLDNKWELAPNKGSTPKKG